ncbi:MAG: 3-phosphoshikimate 1-carboxyvinyltransferase [Nitrososphaerota archaeon]|nr:3-phosphoshikimate 1-carboxyvinyltransferase [Candidatus Bathyarchaeota archaeon]MDW8022293.1 3-phosphoshikimate 1-carboxyvinyltransferase [Nitrososphaerota archaeon]
MTEVVIKGMQTLSGNVAAPPSKAYTHRILIAALLSNGVSRIENYLVSDDTTATLNAIKAFGAEIKYGENFLLIEGSERLKTPERPVNCGESGATLRFMIPVAALAPGDTTFIMGHSLSKRPLTPLLQSLEQLGVKTHYQTGELFVKVQGGGINGGRATLRGDISSQFISGLLFACPMARENTEIVLTTPMESKGYVQMTEEILSKHNVKVSISEDFRRLEVPCHQNYSPCDHVVPGDFSSAAYILAAAAITSSKITVGNLDYKTRQEDKAILNILKKAGLHVRIGEGFVEVEGTLSSPISVDARDVPDLVPACAAIACYVNGISKIYNAKRLRYKESDRLEVIYMELKKMGADIIMSEDSLTIKGPCLMHGAIIDPHNDHRIAMACAAAALGASGETRILNAECVGKSYPTFFRHLKLLGANIIGGEFDR